MRSIFKLSDYEEYLKFLKEKGYIVCDFKEFEKKYNNNLELPEKIIVLRNILVKMLPLISSSGTL